MLSCYRALDLTEGRGFLCGRLLADLGMDVIKVEKPTGDPGRDAGPFYQDVPHSERSLSWFVFNANKRGITLDVSTADGRALLRRLVERVDVVIESFPPRHLDALGLGYEALRAVNPALIVTSITPFGQIGPYAAYEAPDIVIWAMSSTMSVTGDPDRAPLQVSYPQAYLHAEVEAAGGVALALFQRAAIGEGQTVDVSAQQCLVPIASDGRLRWDINGQVQKRAGGRRLVSLSTGKSIRLVWPCRDGFISFTLFAGKIGAVGNPPLVEWMRGEGIVDDRLSGKDWLALDYAKMTEDEIYALEEPFLRFFRTHTKTELLEGALKRSIMLAPVSSLVDLRESRQLRDRGYWCEVGHPELGTKITYPGAWFRSTAIAFGIRRRAPLIGEHNQQIYGEELHLSKADMTLLKSCGAI